MEQFYFKINLNKFGEMRQQMENEKKTYNSVLFGFIILAALLFGGVLYLGMDLDNKYQSRENFLNKIEKEIESYQASGDYLSTKDLERLAERSTGRIFWTRKLEALAEKTSDKIAITHFRFNNNTLSLFGITEVSVKEKEYDLIDEFISQLSNNEQIRGDFPNIKFVKSYRDKEKDSDIMRFQIDLKVDEQQIKKEKAAKKAKKKKIKRSK